MPDDDRHFMSEEFLLDDRILDPERPEFLMYYATPEGMALTGLMFYVRSVGDWGPQIGGRSRFGTSTSGTRHAAFAAA
jgi:hypothetical protein